jgi:DNA-binding NtrC family response regulator
LAKAESIAASVGDTTGHLRGGKAMTARRVILVVEDQVKVRRVIAEILEAFGYDARLAGSAADAYTFTKTEHPDAILLDMNLPDANGTQTLDQLRLLRPDVPIIMVTANADLVLAREALHRGAFDYVKKPFDKDRLGQVLETALDSQLR